MTQGIRLFFSYSHQDEALRDELAKHLSLLERDGVLSSWHDLAIVPGSEWAGHIDQHLEQTQIILLLISADFLASDYCYDRELTRAMERHEAGEAVVMPVMLPRPGGVVVEGGATAVSGGVGGGAGGCDRAVVMTTATSSQRRSPRGMPC
jgi:hypothetical protein